MRRQVDAAVLPGLWRLVEQAPRPARVGPQRGGIAGHRRPASHRCRAAPRPPRHRPCATTAPCPTSTAPKAATISAARAASRLVGRRSACRPEHARPGQQRGRHLVRRPTTAKPASSKMRDHRAQGRIIARAASPPAAAAPAARWRGRTAPGPAAGACTAPAKTTRVTPSTLPAARRKGTSRSTRKVRSRRQPVGREALQRGDQRALGAWPRPAPQASAPRPAISAMRHRATFRRQEAAVGLRQDEIGDLAHKRAVAFLGQPAGAVQKAALALRQHLIGGAQRGDLGPVHAPPLQPHKVQPVQLAPRPLHEAVGHARHSSPSSPRR